MHETRLTLPWPPSLNRIWRAVPLGQRSAKVVLSDEANAYKAAVARALPRGRVPPPLEGRLLVWITLHPPAKMGRRKWDVANREKLMIDTLTAQRVWLDDSQIDALVMQRAAPDGVGRAELVIHTLTGSGIPL